MSARAVIVDSGGANLASLLFSIERVGIEAIVSDSSATIRGATHVILPGVGSAANAMQRLKANGLDTMLASLAQPVLGICLGMQLLFDRSDEGNVKTLGILPGSVRKIAATTERPVPHMGWNQILPADGDALFAGIGAGTYMYFVHSYAADVSPVTTAAVDYGEALTAAVGLRNFHGVQFHPERSGAAGSRLLKNFLELPSCC